MSDFRNGYSAPVTADMSVDSGLRSFMLGVYNKVALGLLVSAVLAFGALSLYINFINMFQFLLALFGGRR